jgi:type IV pilus assembly protein PilY1
VKRERAVVFLMLLLWSAVAYSQACDEAAPPRASVTVAYSEGRNAQRVVFTPSDEGTLRAMDPTDGRVLWTYRIKEAVAVPGGSFMTDVRVLLFDANRDGVIDISGGDRVWLYFGARRAGAAYYALDVTDPSVPRELWHIGADSLPGAGEAWSTPTLARVRIAGEVQNGEHFVLLIGGGYGDGTGEAGKRLFMLDAATGRLLWSAAGPAGGASAPDLILTRMTAAIPARVAALDTDGDGFADRLYAADLGGQVWRFDIWNGRTRSALVTGGVLASLSSADAARRFFNGPDVALIQPDIGDPYYNIAIGSGDVTAAAAVANHDRFYSLRDRSAFTAFSQAEYETLVPILDAALVDISTLGNNSRIPPDAPGWKLDLQAATGAGGERVVGESVTADGVVLFTTFRAGATGCAADGSSRVYALKVETGEAALDLNDDGEVTPTDQSMPLSVPGLPAELRIEFAVPPSEAQSEPRVGGDVPTPDTARCTVGDEALAHCVSFRALVRTFWRRHSTR